MVNSYIFIVKNGSTIKDGESHQELGQQKKDWVFV
jgi:hypothetical protein